jgi:type II secretion system protein N
MDRTKLLWLAGYGAFFWLAFLIFAYWTFPYDRIAAYVSDKVAASGTGYTLQIGDLDPYWFTGVSLQDVVLRKNEPEPAASGAPAEAAGAPRAFKISRATARLGILGLLVGDRAVNFGADLAKGEIEGQYTENSEVRHIDAELSEIDLGEMALLESFIPLPVSGALTGKVDLRLAKVPTETEGNVALEFQKLMVGDGKAKLKLGMMGGLTVDPIEMGTVSMELDVKNGVGTIKKLSADGKDVELQGKGDVRFGNPISRSRLSLLIRLKFTEHYKKKSPRTEAMFTLLDSSGISQVKAAKTSDGAFQFRLTGTLAGLHAVPQGSAPL